MMSIRNELHTQVAVPSLWQRLQRKCVVVGHVTWTQ